MLDLPGEILEAPVRSPVARDVARRAGVSTATVSRVLNGSAGVRADKREAVMRAAQDLGFVANGAARALSTRRFMAVGAVVPVSYTHLTLPTKA